MAMVFGGVAERDKIAVHSCIELLPDLECDVFCAEVTVQVIEESFISGLDDWWPNFVADICL